MYDDSLSMYVCIIHLQKYGETEMNVRTFNEINDYITRYAIKSVQ